MFFPVGLYFSSKKSFHYKLCNVVTIYKCHYTASYTNKIQIMMAKHSGKMLVRLTDYPRSTRIKNYLININKIRAQWWASEPNMTKLLSTYIVHVSKLRSCQLKNIDIYHTLFEMPINYLKIQSSYKTCFLSQESCSRMQ